MGRGRTKGTTTNVKFDPERLTNARIFNGIKTDQEIVNALRSRGITESTLSNARYHKSINKDVLRIIAQYLNVGIHYLSGFELETFDEILAEELDANGYTSENPPSLEIIRKCEANVRKHNRFDKDGCFIPEYDYSALYLNADEEEGDDNLEDKLSFVREYIQHLLNGNLFSGQNGFIDAVIEPRFTVNDLDWITLDDFYQESVRLLIKLIDSKHLPVEIHEFKALPVHAIDSEKDGE